jgi:hypothetical protein
LWLGWGVVRRGTTKETRNGFCAGAHSVPLGCAAYLAKAKAKEQFKPLTQSPHECLFAADPCLQVAVLGRDRLPFLAETPRSRGQVVGFGVL